MASMTRKPSGPGVTSFDNLFHGLPFWARLKSLERRSPAKIKEYQEEQLRRMVQHAYKNVPFYRDLFDDNGIHPDDIKTIEDLKKIPPLIREAACANSDRMISETEKTRGAPYYLATSGSSGKPLSIAVNTRELVCMQMLVLYGHIKAGRRLSDKSARVHVPTHSRAKKLTHRLGILREYYVDLREGVEANLEELRALKPDVINSFPSYLSLMSKHILDGKRCDIRPRLIVTYGEALTPDARSLIEKAFQSRVSDNYGCTEISRISYECPRYSAHIVPASVIVEIDESTKDADGYADIIVTGLYRETMPFIRYRLGDRILLSNEGCACGSPFPIIKEVLGRSDDYLTLPSGRKLSARAINLLEHIPEILDYQIVQKRRDLFEVRIKPGQAFDEKSEEVVISTILEGCLNEKVSVAIVKTDELKRTSRGKLQAVVSEVEG